MRRSSDSNEPGLNVLTLSLAVPVEQLPPVLQQRLSQANPTMAPVEVAALESETREQVLSAARKGLQHYQQEALKSRARTNPAQRNADELELFLAAVEAASE